MTKFRFAAKWLCIAGGCLLLLGIIVFACGMSAENWNFRSLATVKYTENTYTQGDDYVSALHIRTDNADIRIALSDSADRISIVYPSVEGEAPAQPTVQDGTLDLQIAGGKSNMLAWDFGSPDVQVTLPAATACALTLRTSNGDVALPDLSASAVDIETQNGAVKLGALNCAGDVRIQTDNGNVQATSIACAGGLELCTDTGKITCLRNIDARTVLVQTDVGDIDLQGVLSADSTELRSNVGDICATLAGSADLYTLSVQTSVGDSNITSGGNGARRLTVYTDVGDIAIRFANSL